MIVYQIQHVQPGHVQLVFSKPEAGGAGLGSPLDAVPPGLAAIYGGPLKPLPVDHQHDIAFLRCTE